MIGLSKPLTRLIEVISQGIGAATRPYLIRKVADARAHEIRVISDALKDVAEAKNLPVIYKDGEVEIWQRPDDRTLVLEPKTLDERASLRIDYQERKRQANIEHVTSAAAAELTADESVVDEWPDEDWIARFFSTAQEVSSEQMQELWGRILAGEIRRPGTFSLRTLDFVRNLRKSEADLISKLSALALTCRSTAFVDVHDRTWLQENRSIAAGNQIPLVELDVLYPADLSLRTFIQSNVQEEAFFHGERLLLVKRGEISSEVQIPGWKFTTIGQELLPLMAPVSDDAYLEQLGRFFTSHKGKAFIASVTERRADGQVAYQIVREVSPDESLQENSQKSTDIPT